MNYILDPRIALSAGIYVDVDLFMITYVYKQDPINMKNESNDEQSCLSCKDLTGD